MAGSKPAGWGGGYDFADKLDVLGLGYYLDEEREFDIHVGEGGPGSAFFHHYIVVESPDLPVTDGRVRNPKNQLLQINPPTIVGCSL